MYDKCSDCEYGDIENLKVENRFLKEENEKIKMQNQKYKEVIDRIKKEINKIFIDEEIINRALLLGIYENIYYFLKEVE